VLASQRYEIGPSPAPTSGQPFASKPVLVFWEITRACPLSCAHCRASAISRPLPGELTTEEGFRLIDEVTAFGKPYPTMIFTGGDPLKRNDLSELLAYASEREIRFAVSPAVSELLTEDVIGRFKELGTSSISISLDGAKATTHDSIRRSEGTYERTLWSIRKALELGLNIQVNTTVMKTNLAEVPEIFHLVRTLGVKVWEVFFLVKVGRGTEVEDLEPGECESVCNLLYDASRYGVTVRTVEAPFIRRVARQRSESDAYQVDGVYLRMKDELLTLDGEPTGPSTIRPRGTLDGDGIIFVAYDGTIHPGGLLPVDLGNVKIDSLARVYRQNKLLRAIRARGMTGRCGACDYRLVCGGSRARAFAHAGDPLAPDPACMLAPL